ncbi:MAG: hypothetical protein ACLFVB_05350, partial [Thermoplasmata archaeon]
IQVISDIEYTAYEEIDEGSNFSILVDPNINCYRDISSKLSLRNNEFKQHFSKYRPYCYFR